MGKKVLAFDFGASSGRAVVFELADGKLCVEEIHRFDNDPVMVRGSYCWDVLRLFHEIKQGILKCKNAGAEISAIGIDTWGVDYGLLDKEGRLLPKSVPLPRYAHRRGQLQRGRTARSV